MLRPARPARAFALAGGSLFVLFTFLTFAFHQPLREKAGAFISRPHHGVQGSKTYNSKLHMLLPASNAAVDMCKTLLTGAMLGYPIPTLIAWNETHDQGHLLGGGSHLAKISKVLEYMENLPSSMDDELVVMMDAYDIWFQLPPEVLVSRYYMINEQANKRLRARLGNAYDAEHIRQKIIFGAGKRCAPNQMHTVACYPIPDSPVPDDTYGGNTDTVMGKNKYSSLKQRFLNSGYIIGPLKDMRMMFRRAWEKVEAAQDYDVWDNGSHGSDFMYHGSDQSIFNTIWGEQEYQREVLRRRHLGIFDRMLGRSKPPTHHIEGTPIEDLINPPFTHQAMEHKEGRPDEFGIGVDYFSDLGHQTINTEDDTKYLTFDQDIPEQLQDRKGLFDCPSRVTGQLPKDLLQTTPPSSVGKTWSQLPLFTNLCLDTIPVMIHHNGDKGARSWQWPISWMQGHARQVFERILGDEEAIRALGRSTGGAYLPSGEHLGFRELCPQNYEYELFRDVEKPDEEPPGL